MKYWLYICTIYVLAHFSEEHLVVARVDTFQLTLWINIFNAILELKVLKFPQLKPNVKREDKTHETSQLDPSSRDKESEEGAQGKLKDDDKSTSGLISDVENGIYIDETAPSLERDTPEESNGENGFDDGSSEPTEPDSDGPMMPEEAAHKERAWSRFASETITGNRAEIMGTNPHTYQPDKYNDFSRRFVPQYPYTEANKTIDAAPEGEEIVPIEAPQELVAFVAKESTKRVAAKAKKLGEFDSKKMLRTGDYWNGVWKEEVNPKSALRTENIDQVLGIIKAKIKPGNEFYELVSRMKKISPRLLYIINENKENKLINK